MYAIAGDFFGMNNNNMSDPVFKSEVRMKPITRLQQEEYIPHPFHNEIKNYESSYIDKSSNPKIWGPPFWFSLHTSAAHYPLDASPIVRERMKARILAIPYEIPCTTCMHHASAFIEKNRDELDKIVSGRHELGRFYVNFHNAVNKRYNKPEWSYEDAYKYYSGNVKSMNY